MGEALGQLYVQEVFPEESKQQMQQIAREMNLSETVFVLPSEKEGALRRLRIFTPASELKSSAARCGAPPAPLDA